MFLDFVLLFVMNLIMQYLIRFEKLREIAQHYLLFAINLKFHLLPASEQLQHIFTAVTK